MPLLSPSDVPGVPQADASRLIKSAEALAALSAPCLLDPESLTPAQVEQFVAVLSTVVDRWYGQGVGAKTSETREAGDFRHVITHDTRATGPQGRFTAEERADLRQICGLSGAVLPRGKFPESRARTW